MKKPVVHSPPNEAPISELYVVLSVEKNGNEGICGYDTGLGLMPLVAGYERMLPMMRRMAAEVAKHTGKRLVLVKFTGREQIEVLQP